MKSGNSASVAVGQLQGKVKFKYETIKKLSATCLSDSLPAHTSLH